MPHRACLLSAVTGPDESRQSRQDKIVLTSALDRLLMETVDSKYTAGIDAHMEEWRDKNTVNR